MKMEVLRFENIASEQESIRELDGFRLRVYQSELVGILTLSERERAAIYRFLAGQADLKRADIWVHERRCTVGEHLDIRQLGIECIDHQASLISSLSVADNITIDGQIVSPLRIVRDRENSRHAEGLLCTVGTLGLASLDTLALAIFQRAVVRVCRAMWKKARVIVVDDVFAEFTEKEKTAFLGILRRLSADGISFILLGHDSAELISRTDRLVIVRNGRVAMNVDSARQKADLAPILAALLGGYPRTGITSNTERKRKIMNWDGVSAGQVRDLNLAVHAGEIVTLLDTDRTITDDLVAVLHGELDFRGSVTIDGQAVQFRHPGALRRMAVCLVPEDPRELIIGGMSPLENLSLPLRQRIARPGGIVNSRIMRYLGRELQRKLCIDKRTMHQPLEELAEALQFRVACETVVHSRPRVAVFRNPGAILPETSRRELVETIATLVSDGCGILLLSSDLNALTRLAHRILTAAKGRILNV